MMLAFELSTRQGSVCVYDGTRVVAREAWDEPAARHPGLYGVLPALLRAAGTEWSRLTAVAVGRGPGSFSGIRVALTAAQAIALPTRLPVIAVSSGEALALAAAHEPDAPDRLVVAGDARRGAIWYGCFHRHGDDVRPDGPWALAAAAGFAAHVPPGARLLTSDAARLARAMGATGATERFPDAAHVATLAWRRLQLGVPGDPLEPLYLHPPV
jgi:tRNA threonylcarbamoyladenosine biosynthesis protein TsaB